MDDKDKNERFFKNIASLYAEQEGEDLKNELKDIEKGGNSIGSSALDRKMKCKISVVKMKKFSYTAMPVAACFLLALLYFTNLNKINNSPTKDGAPAMVEAPATAPPASAAIPTSLPFKNIEIEFLSAKLPSGYNLTKTDYDKTKTIYYIENDTKNKIILTVEEAEEYMEKTNFQEININNIAVYGLVKNDYSVIKYEKDDVLYTLTSRYNYKDLIEISKSLI